VVDEQGLPIEGALIDPSGAKTTDRRWWGTVEVEPTITDAADASQSSCRQLTRAWI